MNVSEKRVWVYPLIGIGVMLSAYAQADISGEVDASLNGTGFKLLEFRTESTEMTEHRNWNNRVLAGATHADGSVLVLGMTKAANGDIAVIMQYDEDFEQGMLGETGTQFVYSGVFTNDANKLIALGSSGTGRNLYRFNLDGTPDTGFADNGAFSDTEGNLGSGFATTSTPMRFDSEGRLLIYTAGVGLVRMLPDGSLDSSFGSDGIAATPLACTNPLMPTSCYSGTDIAAADDGAYYVMASTSYSSGALLRYTSSGVLDSNFGDNGLLDSVTNSYNVSGITTMPDSGVVTLVNNSQGTQAKLVHFGPDGEIVSESVPFQENLNDSVTQLGYSQGANLHRFEDNRILVAVNWTGSDFNSYQLFGLFNSDLTPDTSFDDDNGLVIHEAIPATNSSHPVTNRLLAQDNKGRILLVSHTNSLGNDNITDGMTTWAVARLMGSWDGESGGGGTEDTTPNAFSFTAKTDVARDSVVTSGPVTITGINAEATVTVTNGEYSIGCTSSFTDANGAISNDENICVRHTSAAEYSASTTTTLTVGGVSADFVSTTQADPGGTQDTTPDAFSFDPQTDVLLGATVTSNSITVSGIDAAAPITVSNGSYAIDAGDYTTSPGTVENGQSVALQHQAASECLGSVTTTLTIGGVEGSFTSTTIDDTVDSDGDGISDCQDDTPFDATNANPGLPGGNALAMSTSAGSFSDIEILEADAQSNQEGRPDNMSFPYGLASYQVTGLGNGDAVTVTLEYPAVLPAGTRIFKYSDEAGFVEMSNAVISGSTVTLILTDGGEGDADGVANGTIVDPVGPATPTSSSKPARQRSSGGSLSWMLLMLFGLLGLLRSNRQL